MNTKLEKEIDGFKNLWKGGFKTGYSIKRNQLGIEGYLKLNMEGNSCLEIVCGRGQWSKFIYNLYII